MSTWFHCFNTKSVEIDFFLTKYISVYKGLIWTSKL